jgi:hypothetical protein
LVCDDDKSIEKDGGRRRVGVEAYDFAAGTTGTGGTVYVKGYKWFGQWCI